MEDMVFTIGKGQWRKHGVGSMQEDMVFGTGNGQCKMTCCLVLVKVNAGNMVFGTGKG